MWRSSAYDFNARFQDLAVMNDLICGEPAAVPEPSTMTLLAGLSLLGLPMMRRQKRRCPDSL